MENAEHCDMKVGINGFGRIGKAIYRILTAQGIAVPLINDPFVQPDYAAYLLRYDSVSGREECAYEGSHLLYKHQRTLISQEKAPESIPWEEHGVDYVVEATGVFTDHAACARHRCKRVILTAPAKDIPMFVYGVNHTDLKDQTVFSAASCTTNCLAPLAKILDDSFGIEEALMTTVHAVTASQRTADAKGAKWRSARSAANIIPATTGAAVAAVKVLPALEGRLDGMSFRVPVLDGSVVDLTVRLRADTTLEEIVAAVRRSDSRVIGCTEDEWVSADVLGDPRSSIVDVKASMALGPRFYKLISWYDNEFGYSCRVVDLLRYVHGLGGATASVAGTGRN